MFKSEYSVVVVVALLCCVNTAWCQDTLNNEDTNITGGWIGKKVILSFLEEKIKCRGWRWIQKTSKCSILKQNQILPVPWYCCVRSGISQRKQRKYLVTKWPKRIYWSLKKKQVRPPINYACGFKLSRRTVLGDWVLDLNSDDWEYRSQVINIWHSLEYFSIVEVEKDSIVG